MVELDGKHRGDGRAGAGFEQQYDGGHGAVQAQQGEDQQLHRRDSQHAQAPDEEEIFIFQQLSQVTGCDRRAGDDHGQRGVHIADSTDGAGENLRQGDAGQVKKQADHNSDDAGAGCHGAHRLLGVDLAGNDHIADSPDQNVKNRDKTAGVKQTLAAEQCLDKREAHVPGIGERAGKPQDGAHVLLHLDGCRKCRCQAHQQHQRAQAERQHQVVEGGGVILDHIAVQHHGRDDQIEQQIGEDRFFFGFEHARFAADRTGQNHKQQFCHLFGRDNSKFHG